MIDTQLEEFTAAEAKEAGLIEAVKSGAAVVSGTYRLAPEADIEFEQNNFVFKDKGNVLRVGRFKTAGDILDFWELFSDEVDDK